MPSFHRAEQRFLFLCCTTLTAAVISMPRSRCCWLNLGLVREVDEAMTIRNSEEGVCVCVSSQACQAYREQIRFFPFSVGWCVNACVRSRTTMVVQRRYSVAWKTLARWCRRPVGRCHCLDLFSIRSFSDESSLSILELDSRKEFFHKISDLTRIRPILSTSFDRSSDFWKKKFWLNTLILVCKARG